MSQASLVLLHGLNNTPAIWQPLAQELPPAIEVHAPALPRLTDVDAIADALLTNLPERFWLVGFSFGGYVAMAMLERAPERILGVALVCTSPAADTAVQNLGRRNAILAAAGDDYVERTLAQGITAFHPDHRDGEAMLRARREMVESYGPLAFIAHALACIGRPDRSALLENARPLLWIAGSDDPLFPPAAMRAQRDRSGQGELRVIGPAGHLVPLEQPGQLARALAAWLGN